MWKRVLGIGLYFLCSGLWVLLLVGAALWTIPWAVLTFIMGFLSNARPWPELKQWLLWRWLRQCYFGFAQQGQRTQERCIYAVYPHGHYALTHLFYFALNPEFEDARPAIHSWVFYIPFFATFARWLDAIEVTEEAMVTCLKTQSSIIMCPGGIADTFHPSSTATVKHAGFLRVARKAGVKVVPVWSVHERGFFAHYLPLGRWTERWFRLPLPFFTLGRWYVPFLPMLPANGSCIVRIGEPVDPMDEDGFWRALEALKTP